MHLPKPRAADSLQSYWKRFAKEQMPKGKEHHERNRHNPKQGRNGKAASFSIDGECKGPLVEVMEIGMDLARQEVEDGNEDRALLILDRVERLPREYALKLRIQQLKAQKTRLINLAGGKDANH